MNLTFSIIENFVFIGTILSVLAYLAARTIRFADKRFPDRWSDLTLLRWYSALVVFPPSAALWIVLAASLPEALLGTDLFRAMHPGPDHELHLLSDLTSRLEPYLAYLTIAFLFVTIIGLAYRTAKAYARFGGLVGRLQFAKELPDSGKSEFVERLARERGMDAGLLLSDQPLTFVWGYRSSKLIVSSELLSRLSIDELKCVVEHEAAHHSRKDNVKKFFLSALSRCSFALPLSRQVLKWRAEKVELICDEVAAIKTRRPLDVASALVKICRSVAPVGATPVPGSPFAGRETNGIEARVDRLVRLADSIPKGSRAASLTKNSAAAAVAASVTYVASLSGSVLLFPFTIHEIAEILIGTLG